MFKKLMNQAASALTPASSAEAQSIRSLQNMGFSEEQARNALAAVGDPTNTQGALELLLSQEQTSRSAASGPSNADTSQTGQSNIPLSDDAALQRAMEESLISETKRQQRAGAKENGRSAASSRAGEAALARFENSSSSFGANKVKINKKVPMRKNGVTKAPSSSGSSRSASPKLQAYIPSDVRPSVKAPTLMSEKKKEEQIIRSVGRLTPYPIAVDTLLKALSALQKDPQNHRFRNLDRSNPGFQRAFQNVPGVDDLLAAINFQQSTTISQQLVLHPSRLDMALLYLVVSALEQARLNDEYISAKQKSEFIKIIQDVKEGRKLLHPAIHTIDEEMVSRADFMSKCPSEPPEGRSAIMTVVLGEVRNPDSSSIVQRRFDGDDTLGDVLNWIGSTVGTYAVYQLCDTREWCLVDKNRYPDDVPIACSTEGQKRQTLQYLGCWPSGKLQLRPTSDELWKSKGQVSYQAGSSRGLGAGPQTN